MESSKLGSFERLVPFSVSHTASPEQSSHMQNSYTADAYEAKSLRDSQVAAVQWDDLTPAGLPHRSSNGAIQRSSRSLPADQSFVRRSRTRDKAWYLRLFMRLFSFFFFWVIGKSAST